MCQLISKYATPLRVSLLFRPSSPTFLPSYACNAAAVTAATAAADVVDVHDNDAVDVYCFRAIAVANYVVDTIQWPIQSYDEWLLLLLLMVMLPPMLKLLMKLLMLVFLPSCRVMLVSNSCDALVILVCYS